MQVQQVAAARQALAKGDVSPVLKWVQPADEREIPKAHANDSVESGRPFVHAYVEFIHYVERLHEDATTGAGHHAAGGN